MEHSKDKRREGNNVKEASLATAQTLTDKHRPKTYFSQSSQRKHDFISPVPLSLKLPRSPKNMADRMAYYTSQRGHRVLLSLSPAGVLREYGGQARTDPGRTRFFLRISHARKQYLCSERMVLRRFCPSLSGAN
jgi:hypothetical protein